MIGILFLLFAGIWIALCVYLARKIPKWLGITRYPRVVSVIGFLLVLIIPFVDEIVGMRQFEALCEKRAVVHVSPNAEQVRRATVRRGPLVDLPGNWIEIQAQTVEYVDADTGKSFYSYESLMTKGGRIARIALLGGFHTCTAKNIVETSKRLNVEKLLEEGKK